MIKVLLIMKNVIKAIILGAIVFAVCYLFGAFIKMDMNLLNWTQEERAVLVLCYGSFYVISVILAFRLPKAL